MELDDLDWELLHHLQADARISFNELARQVGVSAPTVATRVRRLEEAAVITGYRAEVDPPRAGLGVQALVQMKCYGPRCITLRPEQISDWPEVRGVLRITGDICSLVHVVTRDIAALERLLERLWEYGETASTMILSWPIPMRGISRPPDPQQR
ncbi:Lrp/AsnC family transcriptional regulator [Actinoalloteichus hymeniacidonis]|uniref:Transcriptional regulator n=1 Tax=Actinoalloteichus hymeniacidonis TaxID=340345 RepID=A0AAC9HV46_9PSEU|nr:Lrp/AsnC family transcriptional regulator [Actinoalloteichus hymeniacidonis]AOS65919.1 transcriptional regulator [Actinoalloteichus hymeniacidonis]MBB5905985.1 Lrp/AsnC family leucine-responsive transcriptional regulator [Actinoalloteichus hymeniacidonis]